MSTQTFRIEGGHPISGTIRPSGNKNAALPLVAATMLTDEEVVQAMRLLGETEGIFTETAGGVTVGVTKKLIEQGRIQPDEVTVICITGNGLKTLESLEGQYATPAVIDAVIEGLRARGISITESHPAGRQSDR